MPSQSARLIYQAIRKRFTKASWSAVANQLNILQQAGDQSQNMTQFSVTLQSAINTIKNQLGPVTEDNLMAVLYYLYAPSYQQQITQALNTRKAAKPDIPIFCDDILDIIRQLGSCKQTNTIPIEQGQISRMESGSNQKNGKKNKGPSPKQTSQSSSCTALTSADRPIECKKKWLTSEYPFYFCCQNTASVASLSTIPMLEEGEALLDSGVTHLVVGIISLFTNLKATDMILSVASRHKFPVDGVRDVVLNTLGGALELRDVLLCKHIPGVVIAMGQLNTGNTSLIFLQDLFHIQQHQSHITSFKRNNQWFIPVIPTAVSRTPPIYISSLSNNNHPPVTPIYLSSASPDMLPSNTSPCRLWHQRIGHLSLRNIKRLLQFNAVTGLPTLPSTNLDICHPCSIAKSQHRPLKTPSRNLVNGLGDVILADLIGPLPEGVGTAKYTLLIQDSFSRLTEIVPLSDKAEAKNQLKAWILRFNNSTNYHVKCLRTDNGSEFKNNFMDTFTSANGIIREYLIRYEHHQNGQIECTNRTIGEMARTCLLEANLPAHLWTYAFKHAVWIFNHVLHLKETKTPYELLGIILGSPRTQKVGNFGYRRRTLLFCLLRLSLMNSLFYNTPPKKVPAIHNIKVENLFDPGTINELQKQDAVIQTLSALSPVEHLLPITYDEAVKSVEADKWREAINEELLRMKEEDVFKVCTLTDALKHVTLKDILSTKGYQQQYEVNFEETFAPTPTFNALQSLFAVSVKMKWPLRTFDVKVVFLHSLIDMPIYLWPPKGMQLTKGQVVCLNKALYGTKQAARCWWQHLIMGILQQIGFKPNDEDLTRLLLAHISISLDASLRIKWDKEVNNLVGIKIKQTQDGYSFSQPELIRKLISITPSTITVLSSLPANMNLQSNPAQEFDQSYLQQIGILLYIAQGSRPDIAFSVNYLAQFSMATDQTHWDALEHLIAYMRHTLELGNHIAPRQEARGLECFIDANWGGEGNHSTHGFLLLFHGSPIGWQSKCQATVASLTCQAEYMALAFAAREAF
ncbi:hypothetical protein O181_027765 [Austropuccinia psidii MF-1]|uniref:Integrase catalytic domain-containing protein n=1 Tax=Austropuccinia psidii MF-1 TaxID=1389203 RepID=A0A9Q3H3I5_9BASI|nr:hypothetical protein [Austropuccinia psidii MF-1]